MRRNLKQKYLVFLVMLSFIVIGLYYSYAIFVSKQLQENVTYVKTASSLVTLNGDKQVQVLPNSEKEATLIIENSMGTQAYYEVFFKKSDTNIQVISSEFKGLIEPKERKVVKVLIINKNNIDTEIEFSLKVSDEEKIDKEINESIINSTNSFDHSGANKPSLNNLNLIPVIYKQESDTEGYWYKADQSNVNSLWYDYDSGIWANAVLVDDTNYRKYQKKEVNTEIENGDILGFYVWIPRFKYVILNNSNYTNYEQNYNVIFENKNEQTGTIICHDAVSNSDDAHLYSEVCYDTKYAKIYDNLSSYTHPAFQNKEGFWISKFLVSEGNGYRTIPNANMLKKNISDAITISENILDDKSHLLTNMEYASVLILTNSQYGKSSNKNYFTKDNYTFKRVYNNSNIYNVTGCSSEYNNFSKSFTSSITKTCFAYNDLTNYTHISNSVNYPIYEIGPGSSSTGTIYGVYDMANIDGELVAAFTVSKNGEVLIETPYRDLYSYNNYIGKISSSKTINNLYRYKLGDGIKENFRTISEYGMWQGGSLEHKIDSGVMLRGGNGEVKGASIYTTNIVSINAEAPFRVSISVN